MTRTFLASLALAALLPLGACDRAKPETQPSAAAADPETRTLKDAVRAAPELSAFVGALEEADLLDALGTGAPYTLLAPDNEALAGMTRRAGNDPARSEALADLIREHVIPGYLTPEDITTSIEAHEGKPVTMRTAAETSVTFARRDGSLTVTTSDGVTANLAGATVRASNGAAIPIDKVLGQLPRG